MRLPPGPQSRIPFRFLRAMQRDPLGFLSQLAREYGDAAYFRIGRQPVYVFAHPDHVRDVLVTKGRSFMKGLALQRTKIVLGEGLLTSEGELHRRQRRLVLPAFHHERIRHYGEVMVEYALRTRERWRDGQALDMSHEMSRLTLAVVAKTLFDANVDDEADEIGGALTEIMEMFPLLLTPFAEILVRLPLPRTIRFRGALARLDRTIYALIAERRASGEDRGDLLSMLLVAQDAESGGEVMSDLQVRDEAMTLFLAGHETTANALAWTFYLLAQNRDAEGRMHEELEEVLRGGAPTPADYPRLKYTEMVLAESMRLFPPAWGIGRLSTEEVEIAGYTLPPKSLALLAQWVTHRDPRWFPDPLRFDPMRFTDEAKASRPRFAYFPFGGGTRICIGEGFAWMEGVLLLATIAQKWRFETAGTHPVEPLPLITLRAKGGIPMTAVSRR
ncbi:MAG TPA: cytochrome P450 [Thermoanaerobaculia bacterium]